MGETKWKKGTAAVSKDVLGWFLVWGADAGRRFEGLPFEDDPDDASQVLYYPTKKAALEAAKRINGAPR